MRLLSLKTLLLLFSLFLTSRAKALEPAQLPRPQAWVSDLAGVIDTASEAQLNSLLQELKEKTGAEVAVVTVKSLEGDSIEGFAAALFEDWGMGVKGENNGVLILTAVEDREVKIEVGYGLESILPDGLTGQIIRDKMIPFFKQGDYAGGLYRGALALSEVIAQNAGERLTPQETPPEISFRDAAALFLLFVFFGPVMFLLRRRHPRGFYTSGRGGWGGGYGGFGGGGGFGGFGGGLSGGGGAVGHW